MTNRVVLGIDTSNYTTSVAILSEDGELIANLKRPLPVKCGECGLRQSDAVFAHVKNIPDIMNEASEYLRGKEVVAIGVSERPRNVDGSYMPCFLVGDTVAESMAVAANAPIFKFSHQCGHIMAAIYSSGKFDLLSDTFCAFHVSGGTTEMLRVKYENYAFHAELIGGTADLNAGQVIDRVGVHLGLSFPAGRELEALAIKNTKKTPRRKINVKDFKINLSGLENMAKKLYADTADMELTAAFTINHICDAIAALADAYTEKFGVTKMLFAGGVMSNTIIKNKLSAEYDAAFAEPMLSADNAVGIAYLALKRFKSEIN